MKGFQQTVFLTILIYLTCKGTSGTLRVGIKEQSITGQGQEAAEQFEIWRLYCRLFNNTLIEALAGKNLQLFVPFDTVLATFCR